MNYVIVHSCRFLCKQTKKKSKFDIAGKKNIHLLLLVQLANKILKGGSIRALLLPILVLIYVKVTVVLRSLGHNILTGQHLEKKEKRLEQ